MGSGANVSLQAASVTADTPYPVSVEVSDGQAATSVSFNVTVTGTGYDNPPGNTTWDETAIYVGGDTVMYNGVLPAKWWTQGDRPDLGGVWEASSQPTDANDEHFGKQQVLTTAATSDSPRYFNRSEVVDSRR